MAARFRLKTLYNHFFQTAFDDYDHPAPPSRFRYFRFRFISLYTQRSLFGPHRTGRRRGNVRPQRRTAYIDRPLLSRQPSSRRRLRTAYRFRIRRIHLRQSGRRQPAPLAHQADTENLRQSQSPVRKTRRSH